MNASPNSPSSSRSRSTLLFFLGVVLVFALNVLLGFLDFKNEIPIFAKYGAYVGEYVVLAIWLGWGTGSLLDRLFACSWVGIPWMLASWLGFYWQKGEGALAYSHEFAQVFTVMPVAFLLSALALLGTRKTSGFRGMPSSKAAANWKVAAMSLSLAVVSLGICYAHWNEKYWLSDIAISLAVGVILGILVGVVAILLSLAFLGPQINSRLVLIGLACALIPGLLAATLYGAPGPGGASVVHAFFESVVASVVAFAPPVVIFYYWRSIGIRTKQVGDPIGSNLRGTKCDETFSSQQMTK